MSLISSLLFIISSFQLFHSGFSSFEFHQLKKQPHMYNGLQKEIRLPIDIQLEVITGLILFTLAVFLSFDKLEYLTLRGPRKLLSQNQYLSEIQMTAATKKDNLIGSDAYGEFTFMPSFVDIHAKRKEIREYISRKNQ
ncbi:HDL113Cp [Eremothecium sinecaudum]|uniref:HDL113Cp n=1 Tax=Eremothecium sinecaudum TaxID=45286 RepID=A0A0X8HSG9_9SACH|nr:HDL113Cp [Eremothecium sinecaudum]AMD20631.1 HDL113Cp [Eremothecium sinecaudum]